MILHLRGRLILHVNCAKADMVYKENSSYMESIISRDNSRARLFESQM